MAKSNKTTNEKRRAYYAANKERMAGYRKKYNAKFTSDELAARRKEYNRKYRETHREQIKADQKRRRRNRTIEQRIADAERARVYRANRTQAQRERHNTQCREWKQQHPEYVQAYNHIYRQSLRPVKGTRRLSYWQWQRLDEAEKMRLQEKTTK